MFEIRRQTRPMRFHQRSSVVVEDWRLFWIKDRLQSSANSHVTSCHSWRLLVVIFCYCYYCCCCCLVVEANPDSKRLYDDLLSNYNRLIRPVGNNSDRLTVKLGLKLSQLIDVNLKNQIMTTNVWVIQEWYDYKLQWEPGDYGGVSTLHVPSEHIWLPDIVLYNNADGNYELTIMTKAILHSDGKVTWKPPAIYKSSCEMNVQYFPFDVQNCSMKFGSWTYDGYMVDLKHMDEVENVQNIDIGIDLAKFTMSVEWDVMSVPAKRSEKFYSCCETPYPDITFNIVLRRKSLFYTVNLIIPCVGISFLSVLVFYLPSDSGEKVSLCISILLSLTVFFLLLAEIIPPTSLAVPLLGKYLLFTMILVTLSVVVTVVVLNVNFRSPSTHKMAPWVKRVFVDFLPKILFIQRPPPSSSNVNPNNAGATAAAAGGANGKVATDKKVLPVGVNGGGSSSGRSTGLTGVEIQDNVIRSSSKDLVNIRFSGAYQEDIYGHQELVDERLDLRDKAYCVEIERAIQNMHFIAQHKRNRDDFEQVEADWKYVAMVLDRLFLFLFSTACILGTIFIIFEAPSLYDKNQPIDVLLSTVIQQRLGITPVTRANRVTSG